MHEVITAAEFKERYGTKGKKLKYKNTITEYNDKKYQSTFESEIAAQLDWRLKADEITGWERQVKIELNVKFADDLPILTNETMLDLKEKNIKFYHLGNYYMDFVAYNKDGTEEWIEAKGAENELWKLKFRLTEAIFKSQPEKALQIVKQPKNKYAAKNKLKWKKK